jgi:hypothetical protein
MTDSTFDRLYGGSAPGAVGSRADGRADTPRVKIESGATALRLFQVLIVSTADDPSRLRVVQNRSFIGAGSGDRRSQSVPADSNQRNSLIIKIPWRRHQSAYAHKVASR